MAAHLTDVRFCPVLKRIWKIHYSYFARKLQQSLLKRIINMIDQYTTYELYFLEKRKNEQNCEEGSSVTSASWTRRCQLY